MSRLPAALLALVLATQSGCAGGLSKNQSAGMIYGGGAAVFMGGVVTVDGLACDEVAGGDQACDEDKSDLIGGLAVMGVGLVLGTIGYLMRPKAHADATATASK